VTLLPCQPSFPLSLPSLLGLVFTLHSFVPGRNFDAVTLIEISGFCHARRVIKTTPFFCVRARSSGRCLLLRDLKQAPPGFPYWIFSDPDWSPISSTSRVNSAERIDLRNAPPGSSAPAEDFFDPPPLFATCPVGKPPFAFFLAPP